MCLASDASLTADPGVVRSLPGPILLWRLITVIIIPSAESRRIVVGYNQKYVHELLVNYLFKLAQGKSVVR